MPHEKTALQALDCLQKIATRLRAVRKEAGFKTEKSFAQRYGIPLTTYSQHETGKRKMTVETLVDYCMKLNANVGWVLTGAGEPWEKQQIEKPCIAIQAYASHDLPKENLAMLKQVFLSSQSFLGNDNLSFSEWVDRCFEIGVILSSVQKINDEKIEQIVRLIFSQVS